MTPRIVKRIDQAQTGLYYLLKDLEKAFGFDHPEVKRIREGYYGLYQLHMKDPAYAEGQKWVV